MILTTIRVTRKYLFYFIVFQFQFRVLYHEFNILRQRSDYT